MLITVKKEVEETIEVKTPCWLTTHNGSYYHITAEGDLIHVANGLIVLWEKESEATSEEIHKAVTTGYSCTEEKFKEVLDKQLFKLEETYTKA